MARLRTTRGKKVGRGKPVKGLSASPSAVADFPPTVPLPDTIEGFLDAVDGERVIGWAYDPSAPERRLLIEITAGAEVKHTIADVYREDLENAGKGDGRHGFQVNVDFAAIGAHSVRVRALPSGLELNGSPVNTDVVSLLAHSYRRGPIGLLEAEVHLAEIALARRREW